MLESKFDRVKFAKTEDIFDSFEELNVKQEGFNQINIFEEMKEDINCQNSFESRYLSFLSDEEENKDSVQISFI